MGQTVLPPGNLFQRREGDKIEHLAEGQGDHGEIDAPAAYGDGADKAGQEYRGDDADSKRSQDIHLPVLEREPRTVGPESEIGGVAEGEYAGVAQKEIEAEAEDGPDQDLRGERGGDDEGKRDQDKGRYPDDRRPRLRFDIL